MSRSQTGLPPVLRWSLMVFVGLSGLSAVSVVWTRMTHAASGHGLPPVLLNVWLTDLLTTHKIMPLVHDPGFFKPELGWIYPAPCIFVYEVLLRPGIWLHHWRLVAGGTYILLVGGGLLVVAWAVVRRMVSAGAKRRASVLFVATAMLLSWPIWFGVHQGNIEMVLWFGTVASVWLIFRQRWMAAGVVIGFVSSFKLYPVLLLGMLLVQRKYKEMAAAFAVFAAMTLLAMQYIGPTIPVVWQRIAPGIASFKDLGFTPQHVDRAYLCMDHALIGLIRVLTNDNPALMVLLGRIWIPMFAVLGALVFFLRIRKCPRMNQLLFLILAILLLPPKSYDYTIAMLYLPWAALVVLAIRSERAGIRVEGLSAALVLMAIAFSPVLFFQWYGTFFFAQVTCVVLLVLLVLCCRYPFSDGASLSSSSRSVA